MFSGLLHFVRNDALSRVSTNQQKSVIARNEAIHFLKYNNNYFSLLISRKISYSIYRLHPTQQENVVKIVIRFCSCYFFYN